MITKEQYERMKPYLDEMRYLYCQVSNITHAGISCKLLPKFIDKMTEYERSEINDRINMKCLMEVSGLYSNE